MCGLSSRHTACTMAFVCGAHGPTRAPTEATGARSDCRLTSRKQECTACRGSPPSCGTAAAASPRTCPVRHAQCQGQLQVWVLLLAWRPRAVGAAEAHPLYGCALRGRGEGRGRMRVRKARRSSGTTAGAGRRGAAASTAGAPTAAAVARSPKQAAKCAGEAAFPARSRLRVHVSWVAAARAAACAGRHPAGQGTRYLKVQVPEGGPQVTAPAADRGVCRAAAVACAAGAAACGGAYLLIGPRSGPRP